MKAALSGQQISDFPELNAAQWEEIAQLASQHKVLPMIYDAIRLLPQLQGTDFLSRLHRQSRQQIILQTLKSYDFLKLYDAFQTAGVTPLVVKGIVCRSLYPQADHRPSSDEDVLIPEKDYALCHQVLTQFGMTTEASTDAYEIPYRSAESPLFIELHKHLFPPESDAYGDLNRFFENAREHATAMQIQGRTVYTLCHTDHLFYLICHAFKHFLHSGFGIRQVCDIVLYANQYGSQVDWVRVWENCRGIRAEKFAAAIFAIGKHYLLFDPHQAAYPECWQTIEVDEVPMLQDLLLGGLYGDASMSRKHSSNITLDAVTAQKTGKKAKGGLVVSVFPPKRKLEGRYPYLKNHPWLLPAAWCSRLLHYGKEIRHSQNNTATEALKIGNERVALLKEYGIIR